jgi:hypothetical protein
METELKTQEENNKLYIQLSKKSIDDCIYKNDYKQAFWILIMVLERLNNHDKVEFIDYYNQKLYDTTVYMSHLERCF